MIIDDISWGEEVVEWKETLNNYTVLYVGISTPLDILEQRERSRGNRFLGSARGQYYQVHENVTYDLEIDTHAQTIEENVKIIQQSFLKKFGKS